MVHLSIYEDSVMDVAAIVARADRGLRDPRAFSVALRGVQDAEQ